VSLADIIQTSVTGIQSLADNKSILIKVSLPEFLPTFFGDRDRLIQVITNILSNSINSPGRKIDITAMSRRRNLSSS
jgi:signal transduction histidine kinase